MTFPQLVPSAKAPCTNRIFLTGPDCVCAGLIPENRAVTPMLPARTVLAIFVMLSLLICDRHGVGEQLIQTLDTGRADRGVTVLLLSRLGDEADRSRRTDLGTAPTPGKVTSAALCRPVVGGDRPDQGRVDTVCRSVVC